MIVGEKITYSYYWPEGHPDTYCVVLTMRKLLLGWEVWGGGKPRAWYLTRGQAETEFNARDKDTEDRLWLETLLFTGETESSILQ